MLPLTSYSELTSASRTQEKNGVASQNPVGMTRDPNHTGHISLHKVVPYLLSYMKIILIYWPRAPSVITSSVKVITWLSNDSISSSASFTSLTRWLRRCISFSPYASNVLFCLTNSERNSLLTDCRSFRWSTCCFQSLTLERGSWPDIRSEILSLRMRSEEAYITKRTEITCPRRLVLPSYCHSHVRESCSTLRLANYSVANASDIRDISMKMRRATIASSHILNGRHGLFWPHIHIPECLGSIKQLHAPHEMRATWDSLVFLKAEQQMQQMVQKSVRSERSALEKVDIIPEVKRIELG